MKQKVLANFFDLLFYFSITGMFDKLEAKKRKKFEAWNFYSSADKLSIMIT